MRNYNNTKLSLGNLSGQVRDMADTVQDGAGSIDVNTLEQTDVKKVYTNF